MKDRAQFFFCAAGSCLILSGASFAFFGPGGSGNVSDKTLTFAERVAYQRAIEEVYWRHRIWPKGNRSPKPSLDAVISQEQMERKAEDYLRKSQVVAEKRGGPISGSELQTEMERMVGHSLHPRVLLELFQALDNDPFVIAECLARPLVAERLARELSVEGDVEALARNAGALGAVSTPRTQYKLPQISVPLDCTDDTWTAITTLNAPDPRDFHTMVWTGSEMIVWGGLSDAPPYRLNTGGRYDPATDSWTPTSLLNAPTGRVNHTAVWTGIEMIIWAGEPILNSGGRYNPITDSWTATSTANAPDARAHQSAVWTGSEMIVWGGYNCCGVFNSGGQYNPTTDSWTRTSTINAPEARWYHTVEWTGDEMIVWGGTNQTIYLNTGGRYNPDTDSWTATGVPNNLLGRAAHTAVWTGGEMIIWGGDDSTFNDSNTGARYNPSTDSWIATSIANAPSPRESHSAVWTGSEMIVWGGGFCCPTVDFDTGGRYNAGTDTWIPTSTANTPLARFYFTAIWTGSEMIIWGGYNAEGNIKLNTGGGYCAQPAATSTPTPSSTATPTATATANSTATPSASVTATATAMSTITPSVTATATPTPTVRPTPTPRPNVTPRIRPTPPPRP